MLRRDPAEEVGHRQKMPRLDPVVGSIRPALAIAVCGNLQDLFKWEVSMVQQLVNSGKALQHFLSSAVPTYVANLPHPFIPTNVHVGKNHHEDDQQYYEGFQLTHSPHDQPHVLASTYGNFPAKGAKQSASISGGVAKQTSKTQRNNARKRSNKNQNKDAAGPVPNVILTNPVFVAKEDVLKRPKGAPESLYPGKFDDLKKELCKRGINRRVLSILQGDGVENLPRHRKSK